MMGCILIRFSEVLHFLKLQLTSRYLLFVYNSAYLCVCVHEYVCVRVRE